MSKVSAALAEVLRDAEAYFNVRDCPSIIKAKATAAAETAALAKCSNIELGDEAVSLSLSQNIAPSLTLPPVRLAAYEQRPSAEIKAEEDKNPTFGSEGTIPREAHRCEGNQASSKESALLSVIASQPLDPISEEALPDEETWKMGNLADGQSAPEAWMQSWAQQVSELMKYFSSEIGALTARVDTMEARIKEVVTEKHLEMKAAESRDLVKRLGSEMQDQIAAVEASLREELSKMVLDAVSSERESRMNDVSKLHYSLQAVFASGARQTLGGLSAGSQPSAEVPFTKSDARHVPDVVGSEWKAVAADLSELRTRLAEEVLQSQTSAGDPRDLSACQAAGKSSMNVQLVAADWGPQIVVSPNVNRADSPSQHPKGASEAEGFGIENSRTPTIVRRLDAEIKVT
jgi:hypothetical protein